MNDSTTRTTSSSVETTYQKISRYYINNLKDEFCVIISMMAIMVCTFGLEDKYIQKVKIALYIYAFIDAFFSTKDLIFHHILIILTCSFYDIFFPINSDNAIIAQFEKDAVYSLFNTEQSSIFLCGINFLKRWNMQNTIYMQICMYVFLGLFVKTRIVDFFFRMWSHPNHLEVIFQTCYNSQTNTRNIGCLSWYYFSIISLMSLNIYWFMLLLKKLSRQLITLYNNSPIIGNYMIAAKILFYGLVFVNISSHSSFLLYFLVLVACDFHPPMYNHFIEHLRPWFFHLCILNTVMESSKIHSGFLTEYINNTFCDIIILCITGIIVGEHLKLISTKIVSGIIFLVVYGSIYFIPIFFLPDFFWMTYYYFGIFYTIYFIIQPIEKKENETLFLNILCCWQIFYLQSKYSSIQE